jgi:hypothetical protein
MPARIAGTGNSFYMPFFILSILIQVALVIHVLKTGRNTIWIWVLVMLPLAGPIAYVVMELLPELTGSRAARRVVSTAKRTIDPSRDLRSAHQRLRVNDSIESRRRVADELCNAGKYAEAIDYYRQALVGLYEHDPHLLLGLARAQFELGEMTPARETLDRLIKENPDFRSPDGHLLYAKALESEGNKAKAREEFETLAKYYPGAEARYRFAALLKSLGENQRAKEELTQLLHDAEAATNHYRKAQKEWLSLAKRDIQQL